MDAKSQISEKGLTYREWAPGAMTSTGILVLILCNEYGVREIFFLVIFSLLLALVGRIGSVNTDLSDDQLSKCLKETEMMPTIRAGDNGGEMCYLPGDYQMLWAPSSNQPKSPQLYIYSSADRVIPAKSVESFVDEQRRSGNDVQACNFVSSPHVDHFRNKPQLYKSLLTQFLDNYVIWECKGSS